MNFFDLVNISERYMELVNPASQEKILAIGRILNLNSNSRVVDFGCGYGEMLALWAAEFGISGTGVELRDHACQRAIQKMIDRDLRGRIEIVCGDAAEYEFRHHAYTVATCVGASFIWGGFRKTVLGMKPAIEDNGRLVIGEPYWLRDQVPPEYMATEPSVHFEKELLEIVHEEGFDIEYVVRSNHDDWDRYEAGNWYALVRWIEENPDHPERKEVIDHLHTSQELYFKYTREYLGWAMYVLNSASY
ncbi:MAG: class I SAM-dependent methyltransferase [Candidatus Promineifilaceae bacterium]